MAGFSYDNMNVWLNTKRNPEQAHVSGASLFTLEQLSKKIWTFRKGVVSTIWFHLINKKQWVFPWWGEGGGFCYVIWTHEEGEENIPDPLLMISCCCPSPTNSGIKHLSRQMKQQQIHFTGEKKKKSTKFFFLIFINLMLVFKMLQSKPIFFTNVLPDVEHI